MSLAIVAQAPTIGDILPYIFDSFDLMLAVHLIQVLLLLALLRAIDWYEREPLSIIVGMFLWGGTFAIALSGLFNTWLGTRLPADVEAVFGAALTAPLVEELAKGIAILAVFAASMWAGKRWGIHEFGGVTDGVVYGAASGFGFAFFENVHYFVNTLLSASVQTGNAQQAIDAATDVFLLRVNFFGLSSTLLLHGVATALTGAGLGMAVWARGPRRYLFAVGGLAGGMAVHAVWNGWTNLMLVREYGFDLIAHLLSGGTADAALVQQIEASMDSAYTTSRWIFYLFAAAVVAAIVLWLRYEGRIIRYELAEEVNSGLVPQDEYELLTRFRARSRWYWRLVKGGQFDVARALRRSHDGLVDLAMDKWRVRSLGGDPGSLSAKRAHISAQREHAARLASIPTGTSSPAEPVVAAPPQ